MLASHPGTHAELGHLCSALAGALEPLREALDTHSLIAAGVARELQALQATHELAEELLQREDRCAISNAAAADELRTALARVLKLGDSLRQLEAELPAEIGQINLGERVERRLHMLGGEIAALGLNVVRALPRVLARGDVSLLGRAVDELVDNAVLHNVPGGWLEVGTETLGGRVLLRVGNGGEPIGNELARSLPDPFKRLHTAERCGPGLGLTLVRRIVAAHGGMTLICGPPSGGLAVELELPGAAAELPGMPRRLREDPRCGRP